MFFSELAEAISIFTAAADNGIVTLLTLPLPFNCMKKGTRMDDKDLPRTIPELRGPLSQNEFAHQKQIRTYNSLPAGDPSRRTVYAKIQELSSYSDWD